MKTVNLTNEEIEMILEDISSTKEYFDSQLCDFPEPGREWNNEEREDSINQINIADSIIKKLEDF